MSNRKDRQKQRKRERIDEKTEILLKKGFKPWQINKWKEWQNES